MRTICIGIATLLVACTTGELPVDGGGDDAAPDAAEADAGAATCETAGSTLGTACTSSTQCDDLCFCNGVEVCEGGACVAGALPCADEHACTGDLCDEATDRCSVETDDALCDDGDPCNGAEVCDFEHGCLEGLPPTCTDGDPCTTSRCDSAIGCVFEPRDLDGDGAVDDRCGGTDCDDTPASGASVLPGADELCDNGIDDDCDGLVDFAQASCAATNDTCADARVLAGPGMYEGTTRGAGDDLPLGCAPSGIDVVFRFTLTESQDVVASVTPDSGAASVAIRTASACDDGPDHACGAPTAIGRGLAPGEYAVIVRASTATRFDLSLAFGSATPAGSIDVCSAATPDISGGGTFTGLFESVADDYSLTCRTGASTRDAVYRLVLDEPSDVSLSATTTGGGTTSTYLALVRECSAPSTAIACVQHTTAVIERRTLPAGTYFVILEAASSAAVSWRLTADVRPAMPRNEGDTCSTEVDITNATATVPLAMLTFDDGTGCGGGSATFRDASFVFTTTAEQDVVLTTQAGGFHFAALAQTCGDVSTERACTSGTGVLEQRFVRLPAGTWHVTVSTGLSSGDVVASARIEPPTLPPANDTCAAPPRLADTVPQPSSLQAASDDVLSCGAVGSVDTVHELVLEARRNVTLIARRTDGSSELLAVGVRSDCAGSSSDLTCASGAPAVLNRTLEPGTYYVIVESAPAPAGSYTLTAYLADP